MKKALHAVGVALVVSLVYAGFQVYIRCCYLGGDGALRRSDLVPHDFFVTMFFVYFVPSFLLVLISEAAIYGLEFVIKSWKKN